MKREDLMRATLDTMVGPSMIIDRELQICLVSHAAEALLGMALPRGASAPALLCGDRPKRPVSDALAAGRPVEALIPHPNDATRGLHVRSTPLRQGRKKVGSILQLRAAPGLGSAAGPELFHGLWSADAHMKELFRLIDKVALDVVPVLVRGESGTGKELVARALHDASPRHAGPFRAINCAALPPNLLESELFGHTRGAFTGAVKAVKGYVQMAHGGSLFLDEVAEVPLDLQAKLLRVIETNQVIPIGGREPIPVDVRFVSATHRSLRDAVEAGTFRADLMYRLRVIPLFLPPLRDRPRDVTLLVERFIVELNPSKRRRIETVSVAATRALERYAWPGNVRELKNALAYAYAIGDGPTLELEHLPPEITSAELGTRLDLNQPVAAPSRAAAASSPAGSSDARAIQQALARVGGNRAEAAALLGVSRVTLWRHMRSLGL